MNGIEPRERKRRLFVALWPPDDVRRAIEHETRHAARMSGGRVIPIKNLHITLAFLGATPESRVAEVIETLRTLEVQPFELVLGTLKWWARQEMLCLEPTAGTESLGNLAHRVQDELRKKRFELEARPFRAHLTLARNVRHEHLYPPVKPLHWKADRIELVESRTLPSGSVYTVLPR